LRPIVGVGGANGQEKGGRKKERKRNNETERVSLHDLSPYRKYLRTISVLAPAETFVPFVMSSSGALGPLYGLPPRTDGSPGRTRPSARWRSSTLPRLTIRSRRAWTLSGWAADNEAKSSRLLR